MSVNLLIAPDVDQAERFMRHVGATEALEAGILTPMAGTRPVRLFSLAEAEHFLVEHNGAAVALGGAWATVNYVDPGQLAAWVENVLGDTELSVALTSIASTRRPYGFLVPEMKTLIASRVEQLNEVLGVVEVAAM